MPDRFSLILAGGQVFTPGGLVAADVGVRDGRIAALGALGTATADRVLDCAGLHVLPGVIDTQVHFREPGLEHKEDLESGTRSAVAGGVTAVFEMPNTKPLTADAAALADKLARARGRAWCDHAFFMGATAENAGRLAELEELPGCAGVKIFMGSSTGDLLVADDETLARVLAHGRRRVAVHAEDERRLVERRALIPEGAPHSHHPHWRDSETAIRATTRLLALARAINRQVHVLHVTTGAEMGLLAAHRDVATVEVTPQHLTLAGPDCYDTLGARAQMNPPIRDAAERAALWRAVADGTVDVVGSDHAPHTLAEKAAAYPASPSGMPGVQTLVPLLLDHVAAGRLSLQRFVDLTSSGPQRVYGIAGKGRIAAGYDDAGRHEAVPTLSNLPMFHLTAGTWEEVFLKLTQTAARELAAKEVPVCMVTRHSGHDTALWKHELAQALPRAWGKTPAPVFDETKLPFPFRRFTTTDRYGRTVTAYISQLPAKAADGDAQKLPLVLWITGSGSQSLFHKTPSGQIAGGLQNLLHQAAKGRYRVLCVEKPGVNYLDWPKQPGSAQEASEEFRREHTLPRWAEANAAALRAAWQIPEIDRSRTLVLGHSEGALTAARVAAEVPEVTHVAPLASAGATQLHGLVEFAAERAKTAEEGNLLRNKAYEEWKMIMARPEAIDQFWMGHPYRRWSSFCRHNSVNELLRSSARIYLAQGTADKSSHISELDLLRAELAVHGRDAVVERIVGVDHGYRPAGKEQAPGPPVELMALFERIVEWYLR